MALPKEEVAVPYASIWQGVYCSLNSSSQCVLNIATGNAEGNITPRCPLGTVSTSVTPPVAGLSPVGLGPFTTPYN